MATLARITSSPLSLFPVNSSSAIFTVPQKLTSFQSVFGIIRIAQFATTKEKCNKRMRIKSLNLTDENLISQDDPLLKSLSGKEVPIINIPKRLAQEMGKAMEKKVIKEEKLWQEKMTNLR